LVPITSIIVTKEEKTPSDGFFRLYGIPERDKKRWWLQQLQKIDISVWELILKRHQSILDENELRLLGHFSELQSSYERFKQEMVERKGRFAFWWSFPIEEGAQKILDQQGKFWVYINIGNDRLAYRYRVIDYVTTNGNQGIQCPYPGMCEKEYEGLTQSPEEKLHPFKTWFLIDVLEKIEPPYSIKKRVKPFPPFSNEGNFLLQNRFGYMRFVEPIPSEEANIDSVVDNGQAGYVELRDNLINDAVAEEDYLGFNNTVEVVAKFLKSKNTKLPLTIAIDGAWGTGKSSFMNLLVKKLELTESGRRDNLLNRVKESINNRYSFSPVLSVKKALEILKERNEGSDFRVANMAATTDEIGNSNRVFETVHFNAWRYGNGDKLTSSLVRYVIEAVANKKSPMEREEFWFRLNLSRLDKDKVRHDLQISVFPFMIIGLLFFISLGCLAWLYLYKGNFYDNFGYWVANTLSVVFPGGIGYWFFSRSKEKSANIKFSDYFNIPNYDQLCGAQYAIEHDFRIVVQELNKNGKALALFIDDLDRCTPHQIVNVIEDINIFFALQNIECVFILGLNRDLVATSIEEAYRNTVTAISNKPFMEDELPFGQRFLEKIIQFTIPLPEPDEKTLDAFIEYLANNKIKSAKNKSPDVYKKTNEFVMAIKGMEDIEVLDQKETDFFQSLVDSGLNKYDAGEWTKKVIETERIKRVAASIDERGDEVVNVLNALKLGLRANARQYVRLFNELRFQYHMESVNYSSPPDINGLLVLAKRSAINVEWPSLYRMIALNKIDFDELLNAGQSLDVLKTLLNDVGKKCGPVKLDTDIDRLHALLSASISV